MLPTVNLWWLKINEPPYFYNYSYEFNTSTITKQYNDLMEGFVYILLKRHCILKHKVFNVDSINPLDINVLAIPIPDRLVLINAITKLPDHLIQTCVKNNIKIVAFMPRETIDDSFKELLSTALSNKNIDPQRFTIIVNGYGPINNFDFNNFVTPINVWDNILRDNIETHNIYNNALPLVTKKYKFSTLAGSLNNRFFRVLFLAECYSRNLINESFFYSIVSYNEVVDYLNITHKSKQYDKDVQLKINCFLNSVFEHKIYDESGKRLDSSFDIYGSTLTEFKIPPQVLNSQIHVVLETRFNEYSITEKTYKPLSLGLPFVWFGPKGLRDYLISEGYKMYPFIDYSYDNHSDPFDRVMLLVAEIERLNKLPLDIFVESSGHISQHNIDTFYKNTNHHYQLIQALT